MQRGGLLEGKSEFGSGAMADNPKTGAADNTETDPEDWVSGDEPMTGAQASYLKTLSEQVHEPEAFADNLTKAEASQRIDALKRKLNTPA